MDIVKIKLDYMSGPIWQDYFDEKTNTPSSGIEIVDNDEKLQVIGKEISDLYDSYYSFKEPDQPCVFDYEKEKLDKNKMLELLSQLNKRLAEINDGSFVVEDEETLRIS